MEQAPSDLATSEGAVRGTLPADEKGAPVEEGVPDCSSEGQAGLENEDESTYPAKPRVILVVIALALCSFIVGMVRVTTKSLEMNGLTSARTKQSSQQLSRTSPMNSTPWTKLGGMRVHSRSTVTAHLTES